MDFCSYTVFLSFIVSEVVLFLMKLICAMECPLLALGI